MSHFGRVLGFGAFLTVIAVWTTPELSAQKKKDGKDKATDSGYGAVPADYKAIQKTKDISGVIQAAGSTSVILRVDSAQTKANPNYQPPKAGASNYNSLANQLWRTQQDLMRQEQALKTAKNPKTYAQALQRYNNDMVKYQQEWARYNAQMMQQYNKNAAKNDPNYQGPPSSDKATKNDPYMVVHNFKDYELEFSEKFEIRKLFLPKEFDDTGNLKQYSDKEKAELRGDDKSKPGYSAKLEEATAGTEAKLYLTPPKKRDKDSKDDEAGGIVDRPTVYMMVLTKENPNPPSNAGDKGKKKKKN